MSTIAAARAVAKRARRGHYLRYVARRLAHGVVVVVLVLSTVFVATRLFADPAAAMVGDTGPPGLYEELRRDLGLDQPIYEQYVRYLGDLLTFTFGDSFWQKVPVLDLIADRLPNTLTLVGVAMIVAVLIGTGLGIVASLRPGSMLDQVAAGTALLGLCLPQFWLGAVLILLGAVSLGWFPTAGIGGPAHYVLPVATLALPALGRIAQITRTALIDEFAAPHIQTARARGLSETYIVFRHALRGALVPMLTICSWETVVGLGGYAIVVETVFAWPGLGQLTLQAISRSDLPLVQGIVIVIALIIVVVNLATDLAYRAIDPRIEL